MREKAIAHENQTLKDHLEGVAGLCRKNADKIGCANYGELLGLLHDIGKYSQIFQDYIKSAVGLLDPDNDIEYVDTKELKGKIDHSTAGAQFLGNRFSSGNPTERILTQILSLCLVSHHSGIIDCLTTNSEGTVDNFSRRIVKTYEKTHFDEIQNKVEVLERLNFIISEKSFTKPIESILKVVFAMSPEKNPLSIVFQFQVGLFVRFLFSALIDADRQNTADSEKTGIKDNRQNGLYLGWQDLIERLERRLVQFGLPQTPVDNLRVEIAQHCLDAAGGGKGIYSLTVPTGGGKTLASLRFALHHAKIHDLDRIIYIIPFNSIIDQNADVVSRLLKITHH